MLNLITSFFAVSRIAKRNIGVAIIAFAASFNTLYAQDTIIETGTNISIATANYLDADTIMQGAICPAGSVNYFKIKPDSDGILKLKASITQATVTGRIVPLDFGFYNDSGKYIGGYIMPSDSPGTYAIDSLVFDCISADTFYIMVYDQAFTNDCSNYFFSYSITPTFYGNNTPVDTVPTEEGLFFGPATYQYGHNGFYEGSAYEQYRILKKDTSTMELYVRSSTQSEDTSARLNIFYADSSGNVVGNFAAKVGLINKVSFDSVLIPAAPIADTVVVDTFGSIYDDTLALTANFTSGVCGSYELYYGGVPTGINMLHALQGNISLYPNPTSGMVKLVINSPQKGTFNCDVFNVMGEDVYTTLLPVTSDNTILSATDLNLSYLPKGIYFVRVSDGQNVTTRLLAIQ